MSAVSLQRSSGRTGQAQSQSLSKQRQQWGCLVKRPPLSLPPSLSFLLSFLPVLIHSVFPSLPPASAPTHRAEITGAHEACNLGAGIQAHRPHGCARSENSQPLNYLSSPKLPDFFFFFSVSRESGLTGPKVTQNFDTQ